MYRGLAFKQSAPGLVNHAGVTIFNSCKQASKKLLKALYDDLQGKTLHQKLQIALTARTG
jgi:hypothetical protein